MLSPSIRQVSHALLTRPPLTYNSLGFVISPFDLHVLGTPPAFILSQDQTLMLYFFNFSSSPASLFWLPVLFLVYCFWLSSRRLSSLDFESRSSLKFRLPPLPCFSWAFCSSFPLCFPSLSSAFRFACLRQVSLAFFVEFSGLHYCLFVKVHF